MKAGFLLPDEKSIYMQYHQIEEFCIEVCEDYIGKNSDNLKKFITFKSNYKYFNPYFDFAIFELKYKMLNPLFKVDKIIYNLDEEFYIGNYSDFIRNKDNKDIIIHILQQFKKCSDKELQISKRKNNDLPIGLIDNNDNYFDLLEMLYHEELATIIVNQILINDEQACDKFNEYLEKTFYPACFFLVNEYGFIWSAQREDFNIAIYNDKKISNIHKKQIEEKQKTKKYIMSNTSE